MSGPGWPGWHIIPRLLIDPRGQIVARYRKRHLFTARVQTVAVDEAARFLPGRRRVTARVDDLRVGMSICFDLRFPELYQWYARQGCGVLTVPSSFTKHTGQAHWEPLLRARAIENFCYVLAPNQIGRDGQGVRSFGHSLVVSPWGEVLARASADQEEVVLADISPQAIDCARGRFPGISCGRFLFDGHKKGGTIMNKTVRVAVTGAAGQIGYALLFRIAAGEMFGPQTGVDLSLIELPAALPALAGTVMELQDGAFPLVKSLRMTADLAEGFADADWALLVGSVPRRAGMERGDLLSINGGIFIEQGRTLDRVAKADCRVLVVGNPCNTNAYIAKAMARRIPARNFFAMMMLDQNRARAQLALRARVPVSAVNRLAIWGNHSATQFPDYENACIEGRRVPERISDADWLKGEFLECVQKRGAAVIQARGLSSAGSAAQAVIETVRALTRPTPQEDFFSVGVCSDGSYGVEAGLICGFPVWSDGQDWKIVSGLAHTEFAHQKISASVEELISERNAVQDLLSAA